MSGLTVHQQTPKMEVSGCIKPTTVSEIFCAPQGPSKGQLTVELRKNGSPLATARISLKDGSAEIVETQVGAEADNGSTASKISYFLPDAGAAAGDYTLYFSVSGNVDVSIGDGLGGNKVLNRGPGHCEYEETINENI